MGFLDGLRDYLAEAGMQQRLGPDWRNTIALHRGQVDEATAAARERTARATETEHKTQGQEEMEQAASKAAGIPWAAIQAQRDADTFQANLDKARADAGMKTAHSGLYEANAEAVPEKTAALTTTAGARATTAGANVTRAGADVIRAEAARTRANAGPKPPQPGKPQEVVIGGEPTLATWDPTSRKFTPVEGVHPKRGATVENRLDSAEAVNQVGDDIISALKDPTTAATLGPALGRYTTLEDFVGNPPPEFSRLAGQIKSYSLANMGVHGMRSAQGAAVINQLMSAKHTPESLAATVEGINGFSKHYMENQGKKPGAGIPSAPLGVPAKPPASPAAPLSAEFPTAPRKQLRNPKTGETAWFTLKNGQWQKE